MSEHDDRVFDVLFPTTQEERKWLVKKLESPPKKASWTYKNKPDFRYEWQGTELRLYGEIGRDSNVEAVAEFLLAFSKKFKLEKPFAWTYGMNDDGGLFIVDHKGVYSETTASRLEELLKMREEDE